MPPSVPMQTAAPAGVGRRWPSGAVLTTLLLTIAILGLGTACSLLPARRDRCAPAREQPIIAAQVDLDYVYDPDRSQQKRNLALLLDRVRGLGITAVWLQAFADPDGDDVAQALYFPNHCLPMRADLFHGVAQALRRQGVAVYAWIPLLAFDPGPAYADLRVMSSQDRDQGRPGPGYRLSPFHPRARAMIRGIYRDLAAAGPMDGILFHDDGVLSDYEDSSPAALRVYRRAGFPGTIRAIHRDPALVRRWSRFKTKYLIDFSLSLLATVRETRPGIRSARALYALSVLQPKSEEWLAQSLPLYLQAYDYTVLLAMPFLENVADPEQWLRKLARQALARALYPQSLVFELQTVDWRQRRRIPGREIGRQIALLRQQGALSFAYYPDDFFHDHPPRQVLEQAFAREDEHAGDGGRKP